MSAEATQPGDPAPGTQAAPPQAQPSADRSAPARPGRPARPRRPGPAARRHRATSPRSTAPTTPTPTSNRLRRAYVLAESSHRGQMRKSGEPYITHPLAVTLILAELGAETTTLTASLLHDTVEDTEVTLDQVRRGVRRRGALSRRRRHQAGEGRLRRRRRTGDLPQDARRHRQRRPRDVDQTRRPAAQHAHPRRDAPREAGPHRQGHPGRPDPARRTARRPGAQDRAGGPGLRDPPPRGVRAHPRADRRQRRRASPTRSPRSPTDVRAGAARGRASRPRSSIRPRHFVSVHRVALKRGAAAAARLRPAAGPGRRGRRLLRRARRTAHLLHPGRLGVQGLHRGPQVQPLPVAAHRRRRRPTAQVAEVLIRTRQMHQVAEAGVIALGNPLRAPPPEAADGAEDAARGRASGSTPPGPAGSPGCWTGSATAPDPDTFWSTLRDDLAQDREITVFTGRTAAPLGLPDGRHLRGRRLRPARRRRPRLHRRPRQRPAGDRSAPSCGTATPSSS